VAAPRIGRRLALVAGGSAVALAVLCAVGWSLRDEIVEGVRAEVEGRLSRVLGGEVRIGRLDLSILGLGADLESVQVVVPSVSGPALFLSLESGRARLSWAGVASLPGGRIHLRELVLTRPLWSVNRGFFGAGDPKKDHGDRKLDVRIDRLEISDATILYEDHTVPFSIRAEDLHVQGEWDRIRGRLVGSAAFVASLSAPAFRSAVPVRARGGFRLGAKRLDVLGLEASLPGIDVSLDGHATFLDGASLVAQGSVSGDLDELAPWLSTEIPRLHGRVTSTLHIERGPTPLRVSGRLRAVDARVGQLQAREVEARAEYRPGELRLTELAARAYGGTLVGDVGVRFGSPRGFRVRIEGSDLDVESLLDLAGKKLPFSSRASLTLALEGEPARRGSWNGSGRADIEGVPAGASRPAVSGGVDFSIDQGTLRARSPRVSTAATTLEASMDLDLTTAPPKGDLVLEGITESADSTQREVEAILGSVGAPLPDLLREGLTGTGSVRTRIMLGGEPEVDLTLRLSDGSWGGVGFREADADLSLRDGVVDVRNLAVRMAEGNAEVSARIDLRPLDLDGLHASFEDFPIGALVRRWAPSVGLEGSLSGVVEAEGSGEARRGSGRLLLVEGRLAGEPFDRAEADVEVSGSQVSLSGLSVRGSAGEVHARILIDLGQARSEVTVESAEVSLGDLTGVRFRDFGLSGQASLSGIIVRERQRHGTAGEFRLLGRDWVIRGIPLGAVAGKLRVESDGVRIDLAPVDGSSWKAGGSVKWSPDVVIEAALQADQAFVPIPVGANSDTAWMLLSGHAEIEGPLARPREIEGRGEIASAEIHLGPVTGHTVGPVALGLRDQVLTVDGVHVEGGSSDVEAAFRYGLASEGIELTCSGRLDMGSIAALWPGLRASGQASLSLSVSGTVQAPDWRGSLEVRNGRVRTSAWSDSLEKMDLVLRVDKDAARLEAFSAVLGGGEVRATGELKIEGLRPGPYSATVRVASVRLLYPAGFRGTYDGDLMLRGAGVSAMLAGRLSLLRGAYTKEFAELLAKHVRTDVVSEGQNGATLRLDLDIEAEKDVWVRNDLARVEAAVDLHVGGELKRPEVTGRIWALEGGTIRLRDVDYRIESASLDFTDLVRINPYLDVKAETRVREYDISLVVAGTADKFRYELGSTPSLSTQDIIALLTTGNTLDEYPSASSPGGGPGYAGDVAADYVAGALTEGLERRLKTALGLDRFRIDPLLLQEQADPTARITLGKRVSKDLVLIYSTDVGTTEQQIYRAEWNATRKLRVAAERDSTGGVGGEIGYSTRLGRGRRKTKSAPRAVQGNATPGRTAGDLAIEGVPAADLEELLGRLPLKSGGAFRRSDLLAAEETIREFYVKSGRLEVRVDSEELPLEGSDERVRVLYRVRPGPRVEVRLEGLERKDRRGLERRLESFWREGLPTDNLYEEASEFIRDELRRIGYYTAEVRADVSRREDASLVRFVVESGQLVEVGTVDILGAQQITEAEVRRVMELRPSSALNSRMLDPDILERDGRTIAAHYQTQGFLGVKVEAPRIHLSVEGDEADVAFRIHEGRRLVVSSVEMPEGQPVPQEQLRGWSGLAAGEVFSYARLLSAETEIRARLDERGYPDARVLSRVEVLDEGARVRFEVECGQWKTVGAIAIVGNERTRAKVIQRELLFAPGDPLSRDRIVASQQRLYRLGIFRSVRMEPEPLPGSDGGSQLLQVRVEEASPLLLSLSAGYDTEGGARAGVSVSDSNLGGYGRSVAFQAAASGIYQRLRVLAKEPRLFNWPLPALASVGWEEDEQIGYTSRTRSGAFRVEKRFRPGFGSFLRYEYQQVDLTDVEDQLAAQEDKLENVQLGDVGYTIALDGRDDPFLTTRGGYATGEVRMFAPPFLSESSFVKAFLQGSLTHTFENENTLVSSVRVGIGLPYGSTDRVPLPERLFAGGDSTLRGFPRDGVGPKTNDGTPEGGQALFLFNEEWRFPIWRSLKGELFYDGGNVWSTAGEMDLSDLRHVVGSGVRLETPIGPIRAEYGRKLDRREGESRGEFFLSIGTAF